MFSGSARELASQLILFWDEHNQESRTLGMSTSSTAQAVAEVSEKEPIGDFGCCESRMAERIH